MHGQPHAHPVHRNVPGLFAGGSSRNYDRLARWVLPGAYRRLAIDAASFAPVGGEVLDVGTGPGVLLRELARRRPDLRLTGMDLSVDMIEAATRNLAPYGERARAVVGDVTELPFDDDSFDLITTSLSLHHWDRVDAAAPELARVLRPGGRVVVYDFPIAPFDELAAAGSMTGEPRTRVRTGVPFITIQRLVLTG